MNGIKKYTSYATLIVALFLWIKSSTLQETGYKAISYVQMTVFRRLCTENIMIEAAEKPELFTRYMELFFTAYEQISMHRAWVESQWFGKKNLTKELDEHHCMVYRKTHLNMDLMTKDFIARPDFLELLEDYPTFEKAVRAFIRID